MDLSEYFKANPHAAIAFSGGVDSSYLLCAASRYARKVTAYYVKSAFQPAFELEDAEKISRQLGVAMRVLPVDVLALEEIAANPANRCYFCKRRIFTAIREAARADGYTLLFDGTNASDDAGDRPGMRALRELKVESPLRLCGLTKDEIRARSKAAGLFTWNKPAYACLATRIRAGETITAEKLETTEKAENYLRSLGFSDFRVRLSGNTAKLQVLSGDLAGVLEHRAEILRELGRLYGAVVLDLRARDEK